MSHQCAATKLRKVYWQNLFRKLVQAQTDTQTLTPPPTLPEFQNLPGRRKPMHWAPARRDIGRAEVIKMCAWVPSSDRPGLHITTMDHDHSHIAGAMSGDVFLSLLSLSFSFQFSSLQVIIHSRIFIHPFSSQLLFSQFSCSNKIHFIQVIEYCFAVIQLKGSVSNEPGLLCLRDRLQESAAVF